MRPHTERPLACQHADGDPIHPFGDIAALREMYLSLRRGGLLFLAVPVAHEDDIVFPQHRIYGPVRLPKLLHGYEFLGRVWNGQVVKGTLNTADVHPPLYKDPSALNTEKHQPES